MRNVLHIALLLFISCDGHSLNKNSSANSDISAYSDDGSEIVEYTALPTRKTPGGKTPGETFFLKTFTAGDKAPIVSEYIQEAGPNQSIALSGDRFDNSLSFEVSDGVKRYNATLRGRDGNRAIVTIPKSFKTWKTFAVWPKTQTGGYGTPFLVNKTRVDWLGPDKYWSGGTINAYGKNLSNRNDTITSYVRLKARSNGVLTDVTPTEVNPYKISFVLPVLSIGIYEVWVHNGHGGDYGWSKSPNNLTIIKQPTWNAATVNGVATYGLKGDGISDNTEALTNAIAALAGSNKTLYIPDGTYLVENGFWLGDGNFRILGQSKTGTIIKCSNRFALNGVDALFFSNSINNFSFENLTITTNQREVGTNGILRFYGGAAKGGIYLKDMVLNTRGSGMVAPIHSDVNYMYHTDIDFIQSSENYHQGDHIYYTNCNFYNTNNQVSAIKTKSSYVAVSGCVFQDYSHTDVVDMGVGRCWVMDSGGKSRFGYYAGNNTSIDFAPSGGWWSTPKVDNNSGEQFLWEGFQTKYTGIATGGTATTISTGFTDVSQNIYCVTITDGKGVGQTRLIKSNSNGVLNVDTLIVIPDSTSKISIGVRAVNSVLYMNNLQGKQVMVDLVDGDAGSASTGYNAYGGIINLIVDKNTIDRTYSGMTNYAPVTNTGNGIDVNLFHLVKNNTLKNCRYGLRFQSMVADNTIQHSVSPGIQCMVYRNNLISGIVVAKVYYKFPHSDAANMINTIVFENIQHTSVPIHGVANQVILKLPPK